MTIAQPNKYMMVKWSTLMYFNNISNKFEIMIRFTFKHMPPTQRRCQKSTIYIS